MTVTTMVPAGFDVAFEMEDLLPGAQCQGALLDRHGKRRTEDRCLKMGMAVAVVPGLLVSVIAARREQLVQHRRQVPFQAGLEFDGPHRRSAADIEDMNETAAHFGVGDNPGNLTGEVVHVAVAGGLNLNFTLVEHAASVS